MLMHLSLRLRIFLLFALLGLGGSALLIGGLIYGYQRLGDSEALSSFVLSGVVGVAAVIALTTWIWILFDDNVARPVEQIAAEMRARAHTDVEHEIDPKAAKYLGDLAPAAAAVSANLIEARNSMAFEVSRATARLGREKAQLEALLAEAPDGVMFCSPDHKVVLYNARIRTLLGDPQGLGLNRPLKQLLRLGPIAQAYERLVETDSAAGADVLVAAARDARLLEARLRLLRVAGQETEKPGYVLSLRDVSGDLAVHAERARLLSDAIEAGQAAVNALPDHPASAELAGKLSEIEARKAPTDTQWWPMEVLAASDIGSALAARLRRKGLQVSYDLPDVMLRCDGFAIVRLLERMALNWQNQGAERFSLSLQDAGEVMRLVLQADGALPDEAMIERWLDTPLSPGLSQFAGRDVLHSHGSTLSRETGLELTLMRAKLGYLAPSLVEYDFDLLHAELPEDMAQAPLRHLSFVVFDTETTGLTPESDEVCQIAAVRVVNGRLRQAESFDMLVNPGRNIPAASTAVHGITNEMVLDAIGPGEAIGRFHHYAQGSVLVAHNAPFDMAFLQRREGEIAARFDQPILDTVLISAIIFGASAEHTLDALCERLGVSIPESARHTALGDALGTAQALVKSLPMLEAKGLKSLVDLVKEFDQHSRLIDHLN